ncbi:hypothetical protein AA0116_g4750 [Alternaria tenuissima]|nr:hypothetical protein AA0116_g4750 [Alternaria tenuissima]
MDMWPFHFDMHSLLAFAHCVLPPNYDALERSTGPGFLSASPPTPALIMFDVDMDTLSRPLAWHIGRTLSDVCVSAG